MSYIFSGCLVSLNKSNRFAMCGFLILMVYAGHQMQLVQHYYVRIPALSCSQVSHAPEKLFFFVNISISAVSAVINLRNGY